MSGLLLYRARNRYAQALQAGVSKEVTSDAGASKEKVNDCKYKKNDLIYSTYPNIVRITFSLDKGYPFGYYTYTLIDRIISAPKGAFIWK